MCLLKQEMYGAAEVDCNLSIQLDPTYTKSYHRRATARAKLGKLEEARKDFEHLLKLEPQSKLAQVELNKLEQSIEMRQLVFPIVKNETQRSKKPLKRIEIEEINDESADKMELVKNVDEINQRVKLNSKDEQLFQSSLSSSKITILDEKQAPLEKSLIQNLEVNVNSVKIEDTKTTHETTNEVKPQVVRKKIPDAPLNGYQFKKDWQFLSDNLEDLATYFRVNKIKS